MTKINNAFMKQGKTSKDYVFSVPNYLTLHERCAYVEAAVIAGLKPLKIISDSTATALLYAYQKRKELEQVQSKQVCFVDVGHAYTSLTVINFMPMSGQVVF